MGPKAVYKVTNHSTGWSNWYWLAPLSTAHFTYSRTYIHFGHFVLKGNFTYSPAYLPNNIIHACKSSTPKQSLIKPPLFHGGMFLTPVRGGLMQVMYMSCCLSLLLKCLIRNPSFAHRKSQRLQTFTDIQCNLPLSLSVVALSSSPHDATSQNSEKHAWFGSCLVMYQRILLFSSQSPCFPEDVWASFKG